VIIDVATSSTTIYLFFEDCGCFWHSRFINFHIAVALYAAFWLSPFASWNFRRTTDDEW